jgi:hypothetical protein
MFLGANSGIYYFVDGPSHGVKNEKYVWLPGEVEGKYLADLKSLSDYEYATDHEEYR